MEPIKSFGKLDWSKPLDPEKMRLDQATDYLIRVLDMLDETYGLKGKCVADIGGSNISPEIASFYGMKKMVCVDPVTRWYSDLGYDIQNTRYAQLDLVTNAHFQDAWENKSYFIMDEPAEQLTHDLDCKFDIIVSMSTFEHVDSVEETMNSIYRMLHSGGGILFASYEPLFTCAKGHHVWVNEELCFAKLPELDFFHLKYTYEEAKAFLKGFEKFDGFIDTILEQTYHSHVINRKTFQQHIDEISRSHFRNHVIDYWYRDQEPSPEDLARIKERFGEQRYDVRGIAVTAFKD